MFGFEQIWLDIHDLYFSAQAIEIRNQPLYELILDLFVVTASIVVAS